MTRRALLVVFVAAVATTGCVHRSSKFKTIPDSEKCPAGYHFLYPDQEHRVVVCRRDST